MRVKIVFSYDGSKFFGFQRQNDKRSVQKEVEDALFKLHDKKIEIKGAGRTDAGVHANYQVAHYDVDSLLEGEKQLLNNLLIPDINVKTINVVDENFHARYSVKKKEYIYKINLGPYRSSYNDYFYQPNFKLDVSLMKEAAKYMIGIHDFRNFVAGQRDDYETNIISISFNKVFDKLEIRFIGNGFYRYMVRNLVGALIEVGKCSISFSTIKNMLDNPGNNQKLPTAPPQGLYLNKIWY